jgi:hypothetical protein
MQIQLTWIDQLGEADDKLKEADAKLRQAQADAQIKLPCPL